MKIVVTFLLLITTYLSCTPQQKGDSLAILYRSVYAYENPSDLSTRYSKIPFSYFDKNKLIFIAKSENYPNFLRVKTVKGDTIFVKEKLVSTDPNLSHAQIEQDIENGIRNKNYSEVFYQNKIEIPTWISIVILIAFVTGLYFLRKYFSKIDRWFCRKNSRNIKPLSKPWFINYSLYAGLVIGSMQLISKKEYRWFLQEGMQVWGGYPSIWDWVMWAAVLAVGVVILVSIMQAFSRFQVNMAIFYTVYSLVVIGLYFLVGLLLGAIALVIALIYAFGSGSFGSSGSPGSNSSKNRQPGNDPSPVGAYKYNEDGQRYIKNSGGSWEKSDGL